MAETNTVAYLPASLIKAGQEVTEEKKREQFRRTRLMAYFANKRRSRIRLCASYFIRFFFGK